MTIEEAINWYETKLAVNEAIKLDGPQNDAARLALAALHAQQEPNESLIGPLKIGDSFHGMKIIGLDALAGTITLSGWKPTAASRNRRNET